MASPRREDRARRAEIRRAEEIAARTRNARAARDVIAALPPGGPIPAIEINHCKVWDVTPPPPRIPVVPRYDERKGWVGGDTRTLYAFIDRTTGATVVHPGTGRGASTHRTGSDADVRVATRAEALQHWQDPLHTGWTVADDADEI